MTAKKELNTSSTVASGFFRTYGLRTGIAAFLLLSTSSAALHAQDQDIQKQLEALQAQIKALKSAVAEQRAETRQNKAKIKVVADRAIAPQLAPPGYTAGGFQPIGGFDDKKLHFGGITITPGGFIAAEGLFRSRNNQADISTPFASVPFPNSSLANMNETRFSVRQSRVAALMEGNITPSLLGSAYFEADFNSNNTSSNLNQTDSFGLRVRNAYATLDYLDTGWHILAGQSWSLLTTSSKGITPRNEVTPPSIDSGILTGFLYARQPGIRITKDFDKKLWIALSAEQSQTSFANGCSAVVNNTGAAIAATAIAGNGVANVSCLNSGTYGNAGQLQQLSLNHIPDIIGKVAYEAKIADRDVHVEGFGLYKSFYDRVNYGTLTGLGYTGPSVSQNTNGFAVGGSLLAPILPKVLDLMVSGAVGRGYSRYGSAGLSDATIAGNGAVKPLPTFSAEGGLTYHATPALDFYAFAGIEQEGASYSSNGTAATATNGAGYIGYGAPNANDTGCFVEGAAAALCAGNTHRTYQLTGGVWDKIYQGNFGYFRAGIQYEYNRRELFTSTNGPGGTTVTPKVDEHVIMTSLRYYPF